MAYTVAKGNIREDSNPTHTCEDILVTKGPNPQSLHVGITGQVNTEVDKGHNIQPHPFF